ncbi:hypothetical protein TNCV_1731 [Trichonephila clavipes]|nr:hypothetical protein TNCV_1731 [Trichonephila clavipes]
MSPRRTALQIFNGTPSNKRSKARPKRRWKHCVDENFAILKVKIKRSIAKRRAECVCVCEKLLRKAQARNHANAADKEDVTRIEKRKSHKKKDNCETLSLRAQNETLKFLERKALKEMKLTFLALSKDGMS